MRTRMTKAFTLVEILIVVVILGILAAIVVPQFTNATQDAQTGNLRAQIKELQNQIELYHARTNAYPDLVANQWTTMKSGGYIRDNAKNPAAPTGFQDVVAATPTANAGWHYDLATGTIGATYFDEVNDVLTPGVP